MTEPIVLKEKEVSQAIEFIRQITNFQPQIALVLGSGLGNFENKINSLCTINSSEIPYYPVSSVRGHAGKIIFGYLKNDNLHTMPLLTFSGRVHFYEIESVERIVFPILLSHRLGIKKLIITNAAGGINSHYHPGDLMLIQDIINLAVGNLPVTLLDNALHKEKKITYFDEELKQKVLQCALQNKTSLQQGTYCWLKGPSYETPAEIQMLKRIGVDAVGMSTVPEIFVANRLGIKAVGISLISNLAAGISQVKLSHADVTEIGIKVTERFSEFMEQLILSFS